MFVGGYAKYRSVLFPIFFLILITPFLVLNMEALCSPETSLPTYYTVRSHTQKDSNFYEFYNLLILIRLL